MNVASTDDIETTDAPVSKMKYKGKLLIEHFYYAIQADSVC